MKNFLERLNQDTDNLRRLNWKDHREQITGLFEEVFSKKEHFNKIAIFGAGNCDDLDLEYIASKCNLIYLFDIDTDSIKFATESLQDNLRNKIKIIGKDFTGLDQLDFYNKFNFMLENTEKPKKIKRYIINTANQLSETLDGNWNEYYKDFDIVASSAIYSQLFYNWALERVSEFEDKYNTSDLRNLIIELVYLRDVIVKLYNDSLYRSCDKGGFFISWSDMFVFREEHINIINQGAKATINLAFKIGMGAAKIGIKDVIQKVDRSSYLLRYWKWEFNKDKEYLTFGVTGAIK